MLGKEVSPGLGKVPNMDRVGRDSGVNTVQTFFYFSPAIKQCVEGSGQASNLLPQMFQTGEDPEVLVTLSKH